MKKQTAKQLPFLLAFLLVLSLLSGCGSTTPASSAATENGQNGQPKETAATATEDASTSTAMEEVVSNSSAGETGTQEEPADSEANILVAYFSHTGTTRGVAAYLHDVVGGDLVELIPAEPYPEGYSAALDPAKAEQRENARPVIQNPPESIEAYDVIYLGYPIWWGTVPMIINTFLESYDFTGKTVIPFATSGGTGIRQSVQDIRNEVPDAKVPDGLLVKSNDAIISWLQELELFP